MRLGMPGFLTRGLGSRLIRRALRGGTRPGPGAAYPKPTAVATPPPRLSPALRSLRIRPCAWDGGSMREVEGAGIDFIAQPGVGWGEPCCPGRMRGLQSARAIGHLNGLPPMVSFTATRSSRPPTRNPRRARCACSAPAEAERPMNGSRPGARHRKKSRLHRRRIGIVSAAQVRSVPGGTGPAQWRNE